MGQPDLTRLHKLVLDGPAHLSWWTGPVHVNRGQPKTPKPPTRDPAAS